LRRIRLEREAELAKTRLEADPQTRQVAGVRGHSVALNLDGTMAGDGVFFGAIDIAGGKMQEAGSCR
jgi:hypothetical protein